MKKLWVAALLLGALGTTAEGHVFGDATLVETQSACIEIYRRFPDKWEKDAQISDKDMVFYAALCRQPAIYDQLPAATRQSMAASADRIARQRALAKPEDLAKLDRYAAELVGYLRSQSCPAQKPGETDAEIRWVWSSMRSALQRNDLEQALSFFHTQNREKYRKNFVALGSERLRQIATEMEDPLAGRTDGNMATYQLRRKQGDKAYLFEIRLMLDENCRWRIVSY